MAHGFVTPNISLEEQTPSVSRPTNFKYTSTYGFGVITFFNSTHLHYSTVSDAHHTSSTPLPGDEFWIVKENRI